MAQNLGVPVADIRANTIFKTFPLLGQCSADVYTIQYTVILPSFCQNKIYIGRHSLLNFKTQPLAYVDMQEYIQNIQRLGRLIRDQPWDGASRATSRWVGSDGHLVLATYN